VGPCDCLHRFWHFDGCRRTRREARRARRRQCGLDCRVGRWKRRHHSKSATRHRPTRQIIGARALPGKIFINYQRDDTIATAGRLHDGLAQTFGRNNLFMDVDHIPAGADLAARRPAGAGASQRRRGAQRAVWPPCRSLDRKSARRPPRETISAWPSGGTAGAVVLVLGLILTARVAGVTVPWSWSNEKSWN
jgi:hypothetical protein